jgi:hypothetical protein
MDYNIENGWTYGTDTRHALCLQPYKGNVGIGTASPVGKLNVKNHGIHIQQGTQSINWYTGAVNMSNNGYSGLMFTVDSDSYNNGGSSSYWQIGRIYDNGSLHFSGGGRRTAYLVTNAGNTMLNFTGQHRTFIKDIPFSQAGDLEGLIVSADNNKYIKMSVHQLRRSEGAVCG